MLDYNTTSVKTRRVFAFLLDGFLSFTLAFAVLNTVVVILGSSGNIDLMTDTMINQIMNKYGVLLLLRDFLFGGTSLGKRIFRLRVIDCTTHQKPPVLKRILRCLFFFILPVEAISILVEGKSLGDRVANTIVVSKKQVNSSPDLSLDGNTTPNNTDTDSTKTTPDTDSESTKMKRVIIAGAVFVFAIIAFLALICFGWYSTL